MKSINAIEKNPVSKTSSKSQDRKVGGLPRPHGKKKQTSKQSATGSTTLSVAETPPVLLCTKSKRAPNCRVCTPTTKCELGTFPSTPKASKVKAQIAQGSKLRHRSDLKNGQISQKLKNFEYFRGSTEAPLQSNPSESKDSGEKSPKRSLSVAFGEAKIYGDHTRAEDSAPTKKAKKEVTEVKEEKDLNMDETYLGGTYPYGEYLTSEYDENLDEGDNTDDTLPYLAHLVATHTPQDTNKSMRSFEAHRTHSKMCAKCQTICVTRVSKSWKNTGREFFYCPSKSCKEDFVNWTSTPKQAKKNHGIVCRRCGGETVIKKSKSKKNPGREYHACLSGGCKELFVCWASACREIRIKRIVDDDAVVGW